MTLPPPATAPPSILRPVSCKFRLQGETAKHCQSKHGSRKLNPVRVVAGRSSFRRVHSTKLLTWTRRPVFFGTPTCPGRARAMMCRATRSFRTGGNPRKLLITPNGRFGSKPEVSNGHENVRFWGYSRPQFRATGCLFVARSGLTSVYGGCAVVLVRQPLGLRPWLARRSPD